MIDHIDPTSMSCTVQSTHSSFNFFPSVAGTSSHWRALLLAAPQLQVFASCCQPSSSDCRNPSVPGEIPSPHFLSLTQRYLEAGLLRDVQLMWHFPLQLQPVPIQYRPSKPRCDSGGHHPHDSGVLERLVMLVLSNYKEVKGLRN